MKATHDPRTRAKLWDAGFAALRGYLRAEGMLEVSTPWCVDEVAIEPYIEPVRAGQRYVITSPELWMKRLLCAGVGSSFQVAHVARQGEAGELHTPEFHLAEWYRAPGSLSDLQADVEAIVEAVSSRVGAAGGKPRRIDRWERWNFFELFACTTGAELGEGASVAVLRDLTNDLGARIGAAPLDARGPVPEEVEKLWLWSALLSAWSDAGLQPWLDDRSDVGVHLEGFPPELAALATVQNGRARRSESFVFGVEIANGYEELRDSLEQRRRFERVNALRRFHGDPALPMPERFLASLDAGDGLPECAGIALGLDRVLMIAAGVDRLADISLTSFAD